MDYEFFGVLLKLKHSESSAIVLSHTFYTWNFNFLQVYLYQITWFAAWLVIDQRRMVSNRNAYLPCLKNVDPENVEDNDLTKPRFFSKWCLEFHPIAKYAEMLTLKPVKIFVMIFTLGLLGLSIIGNYYITKNYFRWCGASSYKDS